MLSYVRMHEKGLGKNAKVRFRVFAFLTKKQKNKTTFTCFAPVFLWTPIGGVPQSKNCFVFVLFCLGGQKSLVVFVVCPFFCYGGLYFAFLFLLQGEAIITFLFFLSFFAFLFLFALLLFKSNTRTPSFC